LAFRGSGGFVANSEGQTFDEEGLQDDYLGIRPLINAVAKHVSDNKIGNVVVSGHSLGGQIADLFGLADSNQFSGVSLDTISLATGGIEPEITDYGPELGLDAQSLSGCELDPTTVGIEVVGFGPDVDRCFGITHSEDRVHYPSPSGSGSGFLPQPLFFGTRLRQQISF
jgi:acetyl esterase/lipase